MAQAKSRSNARWLTLWFRRAIARPAAELSRTGRITQTLFDATQLQKKKDRYLQQIGEIALKHFKDGQIKDIRIERILAKMEKVDRILDKQESLMKRFQNRGDLRGAFREESKSKNKIENEAEE